MGACSGVIDGGGADDEGVTDGGSIPVDPVRMVDISGPDVLPHVQRFANAVCGASDACTIVTRDGHHPTASRALDILVSAGFGNAPTDNNSLGDEVAAFSLTHRAEYGVTYSIWRQRYNDGTGWDPMEDRGGVTQNHFDHVHVSFDETAP